MRTSMRLLHVEIWEKPFRWLRPKILSFCMGRCCLKHVKEMDISELLDYIRKMKEENLDIYECLDFMQLWYRDVLLYKVARDMNQLIFKDEYSSINEMGQKCSYEGLEKILQAIDKARIRLDANVNMELAMELMLLVMKEQIDRRREP